MMYCPWDCELAFSCLFFPVFIYFSFSLHFSSKISPQLYRIETSNLVYRFTTTSCIVELKMGLLLFVLPYICSFFFLSIYFWSKISLQGFEIETSKLVYRFTSTSCGVGLKMDILLFVLPLFFFLSFSLYFSSKIPAICFGSAKAGV